MATLFLVQKPNYKKGYYDPKTMCKVEGIDFSKLPDDVRKGKIGFTSGNIIVSILEVDEKVSL